MAYRAIFHLFGLILLVLATAMLSMVPLCYLGGEPEQASRFLMPALLTGFTGGALAIALGGHDQATSRRDGILVVALLFTVVPLFAALPLVGGGLGLSVLEAWFEALSALTTTGASILDPLETKPAAVLFWRALLGWIGGFAGIVMMIIVLSGLGLGGLAPTFVPVPHGEGENLVPRARQVSRALWPIYVGLTVLGFFALMVSGMAGFDALVHAFGALSTSGLSTYSDGLGAFGTPERLVMCVLAFLGALNMTLYLRSARHGVKPFLRDPEVVILLSLCVLASLLVATALVTQKGMGLGQALEIGLTNGFGFATTSGYGVAEGLAAQWPVFVSFVLIAVMTVGGGVASSASGLRPMRLMMMIKITEREFGKLSHPHATIRLRYGDQRLPQPLKRAVIGFVVLFVLTLSVLLCGFALAGVPLEHAVGVALSALSNTGPAAELLTGGEFAARDLNGFGRGLYATAMVVGRMDILALLVFASPDFWRG